MGSNRCNHIQCERFFFEEMSNNKFILPIEYVLYNVYPNPFNPVTNIIYGLSENTNVQIVIFDLSGKQVDSLVNEFQAVGYHSIDWNADDVSSGMYFISMNAGDFHRSYKIILLK